MECPTCYNELTLGNIVNAQCGHTFCKDCFWTWVNNHKKNECPMCRADIINKTIFNQTKLKMIRMCALTTKYNQKFHELVRATNHNRKKYSRLNKDWKSSPYKALKFWENELNNSLAYIEDVAHYNFKIMKEQLKTQHFKIVKKKKLFEYDKDDPINDIHRLFEIKPSHFSLSFRMCSSYTADSFRAPRSLHARHNPSPQEELNQAEDAAWPMGDLPYQFTNTELTHEESDGYTSEDCDSDSDSMPSLEGDAPDLAPVGTQDPFDQDQLDEYTDYYENGNNIQSMGGTGGTYSYMGMNVVTGDEDWYVDYQ